MKPKVHTTHTMKQVHTTVIDVPVQSYSMSKTQKRIVTVYLCECTLEEVMYREVTNLGFNVTEYTKPVV